VCQLGPNGWLLSHHTLAGVVHVDRVLYTAANAIAIIAFSSFDNTQAQLVLSVVHVLLVLHIHFHLLVIVQFGHIIVRVSRKYFVLDLLFQIHE
jgi:hypothetical protein